MKTKEVIRMSELLIISHGELAIEMLRTAKMIMGEFHGVTAMGLHEDEQVDLFYQKIKEYCKQATDGLLIMTDLAGGSPFIQASRCCYEADEQKPVEVVAGLNLSMLMECIVLKETQSLQELKQTALSVGKEAVKAFECKEVTR